MLREIQFRVRELYIGLRDTVLAQIKSGIDRE
jgi:hypothetical protein